MKDKLSEIYKLAGFNTKVAKELMRTAHACIKAAYRWENDRVRQECIKEKLKPAVSDKTENSVENVYSAFYETKRLLDREAEYVSILAENEYCPDQKAYKKIADEFN